MPEDLPGIEHQLPRGSRSPGEAPGRRPLNSEQERINKRGQPASPSTGLSPPNKKSAEEELEAYIHPSIFQLYNILDIVSHRARIG